MNVGSVKGKIVTDLIAELKPETMIELGGYVGYSGLLFGDAVRRSGGKRYLSLELNPEYAAIANMLYELAGLRDFVRTIVGRSDVSLQKLCTSGEVKHVDLMFLDHHKPAYTVDVKLCEHHGVISPGSVLAADNVIFPGNPPYLEYVRSSVEQKREAAKKGPVKGYNTEGIPEKTAHSFVGKDDVPRFASVGNPNLVYESTLCQPEGYFVSVAYCFIEDTLTVAGWDRSDSVCGSGEGEVEERRKSDSVDKIYQNPTVSRLDLPPLSALYLNPRLPLYSLILASSLNQYGLPILECRRSRLRLQRQNLPYPLRPASPRTESLRGCPAYSQARR